MNLISKSKNKTNHEEIDIFGDETHGVSSESYHENVEFENYCMFLKNNIGNKNILVIPIEDDEGNDKDETGLWRFPLKDMMKWNKKGIYKGENVISLNMSNNRKMEFGNCEHQDFESKCAERAKWLNCFEMKKPTILAHSYEIKGTLKIPRIINLN